MRSGKLTFFLKEAQLFATKYRQQTRKLSLGTEKSSDCVTSSVHGPHAQVQTFAADQSFSAVGVFGKHGSSMDLQVCTNRDIAQEKQKSSVGRARKPQSGKKRHVERKKNTNWRWNVSPKAVDLVEKVLVMPDVKEEVYKELDKWVAFSFTFPIAHIKQAMKVFEQRKNWNRIIQVSKWMLSKGQGRTLRTYEGLLLALDMQGRTEEAELLWEDNILKSSWSVPNRLVAFVLKMYERHNKPIEVIKLFTSMEESGRNLDAESVQSAARAYQKAGFLEKRAQILRKYNLFVEDKETSQNNGQS